MATGRGGAALRWTAEGGCPYAFHSHFTVDGSKQLIIGVTPTNDAEHETLEITQGWTDWFETGFDVFTSIQPGAGSGGP